jgi:integrase
VKSQRSLRTAKKVTEALSPLFKRFYKHNKINELNPADIDLGDLGNIREVTVTLEETKRLYDAMFNYPIDKYRHIFLFLATGRRLNEVLSLRIQDIDLAKKMFDIHQDNSKSGKKLTFVLRPEMYDTLKNKTDLIHPSDKGTIMDGSTIRNHWEKVKINAGLIIGYDEKKKPITYGLHIHDIRHIIATELRNSGVTEEVSALVLGHTRSSITARYASANAQLANDVYQFFLDKINGIIEPTAKWVDA